VLIYCQLFYSSRTFFLALKERNADTNVLVRKKRFIWLLPALFAALEAGELIGAAGVGGAAIAAGLLLRKHDPSG
jgi:hypothetical protein